MPDSVIETIKPVSFVINGKKYNICDKELLEESLLNFIREFLHIKDVKCGCNKGFCGSCTLIINGEAKKSCVIKIKKLDGAVITTPSFISPDGLSKHASLIHEHGAVQCGFCFPGIISSLEAGLKKNETPDEKSIIKALDGHICRCTGYRPIIDALLNKNECGHINTDNKFMQIGRSNLREDSKAKLRGEALYADDLEFEGMLHVYVLRSEHAHAKIISIDDSKARRAPGVQLVMTHRDLKGAKKFGVLKHDQPVFCSEQVLFRGDAIALIAADTLKQAQEAAAAIEVKYLPIPPIFDAETSLSPDTPTLCENSNVLFEIKLKSRNTVENYFNEHAGYVKIEGCFKTEAIEHAYMEPECCVAYYDKKRDMIVIYSGSQNVHADREEIAAILAVPPEKIEVQLTHTGGGFGGKEDLTVQPYAALAALALKKPCKYLMQRDESILCSTKKHPFDIKIAISADSNGVFGAITVKALSAAGPYESLSRVVLTRFATHILGPYTWRAYDIAVTGARTNGPIAGAMRGFGVNQACYAVESMIERLSGRLNMNPEKIRRINMIYDQKIMGLGENAEYCSGLKQAFDAVCSHIDRNAIREFNSRNTHIKRGAAIALAYKNMGLGNNSPRDNCSIKIAAAPGEKKYIIYTAASEIGQGLHNIITQIAAEAAGVKCESIKIIRGSTATAPPAGVTSASRQTFMSGNAVIKAVEEFKTLIINKIAAIYNITPSLIRIDGEKIIFTGGVNPDCPATVWDYIDKFEPHGMEHTSRYEAPATYELERAGEYGFKSHFGYSYAAHAVTVEADLEKKTFKILHIVAAHDAGRAINPAALRGQIIGGVVMGLGYAVSEKLKIENGLPDKRGLAGMGLLKAKDIPPITPVIIEIPHPHGPFGARGIGEISTVPIAAALCNALLDATGLEFNTLPIDMNENGYKFKQQS